MHSTAETSSVSVRITRLSLFGSGNAESGDVVGKYLDTYQLQRN